MTYVLKRPSQRTAASESEARLASRIEVKCIVKDSTDRLCIMGAKGSQDRLPDERPASYTLFRRAASFGSLNLRRLPIPTFPLPSGSNTPNSSYM